jgi:hypothetical protein
MQVVETNWLVRCEGSGVPQLSEPNVPRSVDGHCRTDSDYQGGFASDSPNCLSLTTASTDLKLAFIQYIEAQLLHYTGVLARRKLQVTVVLGFLTILPDVKMSAIVSGSRICMMTAAKR